MSMQMSDCRLKVVQSRKMQEKSAGLRYSKREKNGKMSWWKGVKLERSLETYLQPSCSVI